MKTKYLILIVFSFVLSACATTGNKSGIQVTKKPWHAQMKNVDSRPLHIFVHPYNTRCGGVFNKGESLSNKLDSQKGNNTSVSEYFTPDGWRLLANNYDHYHLDSEYYIPIRGCGGYDCNSPQWECEYNLISLYLTDSEWTMFREQLLRYNPWWEQNRNPNNPN